MLPLISQKTPVWPPKYTTLWISQTSNYTGGHLQMYIEEYELHGECSVLSQCRHFTTSKSCNIQMVEEDTSIPLTIRTLVNFPVGKVVTYNNIYCPWGWSRLLWLWHSSPTGGHWYTHLWPWTKNGQQINKRILQEWLEGKVKPALVEIPNIIGKGKLAKKIREKYITAHWHYSCHYAAITNRLEYVDCSQMR